MDAPILWFVETNVAFIALYLFYAVFLKKDTFFREKRFVLILGYLFATLYPFIDVSS